MRQSGEITRWLRRLHDGDEGALDRLVPLLYDQLLVMARKHLRRERRGHTFATADLINEVYIRLFGQERLRAADRRQFFAIAATTMRRVLVDYARARNRLKRGGGLTPVPLEDAEPFLGEQEAEDVLVLDAALDRLAAIAPRAGDVVQYRFFSGLTLEETAEVLGVSVKTVQRDWLTARAWLRSALADAQLT